MAHKMAIQGYFGYANTGDEAILGCMVSGLREIAPDWDITVFSGSPSQTMKTHDVSAVFDVFPTRLSRLIVGVLGRNRRNFFKTISAFLSADILLVGGGGLFFDHKDSNRFLRELLFKIRLAALLGKKVLVVGVSLGPIHMADSRIRLQKALDAVDLIAVRDLESREILAELGVSRPAIHTTGDFVFLLRKAREERIDEIMEAENLSRDSEPVIAISVCGYHYDMSHWVDSLVAFCDHVIEQYSAQVWFVPMQTGGGFDDRKGVNEIVRRVSYPERILQIKGSYTAPENMGLLSRADAVLAERLHGVILALNANTPLFGISYRPKVWRLFKEIDHEDWQVNLDDLKADRLIAGFESVWVNRKDLRADLDSVYSRMRHRASANLELIRTFINQFQQRK